MRGASWQMSCGALLVYGLACQTPQASLVELIDIDPSVHDDGPSDSGMDMDDGGPEESVDAGSNGCTLGVQPTSVDFGQVAVGGSGIANLFVTNLGSNTCLVTNHGVSCQDDQGAFGPEDGPIATQPLSAQGADGGLFPTSVNFQVTFTPPSAGTYRCSIHFSFAPLPGGFTVDLSGTGTQ